MKNTTKLIALLIALAACGDNKTRPDGRLPPDGPPADAQCSNCPPAPAIGTQIDRLGRPTVNTLLNRGFDGTAGAGPAKDMYNADADAATWPATYLAEFKRNLGILDALDTGLCGNGKCETAEFDFNGDPVACNGAGQDCNGTTPNAANNGCGNQVLYNGGVGTTPSASSYNALAGMLAADELWLDPHKGLCGLYFAVEFGVVISGGMPSGGNTTCGGRMPQYDVIDFSLSAIAMGIPGFSTDGKFTPKLGDGVPPHTDYLSTFPYLGAPH